MPAKSKRAWSDLPLDLLCSTLHLLPVKDAIRFGAVCPHWRSAFTAIKKKLSGPRLMLYDRITRTNMFLTLAHDSRPYTICPADDDFYCYYDFYGYFIIGSSNGWLITVRNHLTEDQVHMVNPHTGAHIRLPPVTLLPAAIFEIPSTANKYCNGNHGLAVAQAGGDRWIFLEAPPLMKISDINYNDGMLYAVCLNGNVAVWELSSSNESPIPKKFLPGPELKSFDSMVHRELHIVPGSQHGLLLIARYCHRDSLTDVFDVFALGSKGECERITCLRGCSLFLGLYSHSMCLSAVNFPELKENCIYFIGESGSFLYNLEDGKVYEGNQSSDSMRVLSATWVMPNLK